MAGKYYQRIAGVDYDLTTLCEPKVHDAAPGFGTEFVGETFQKAGTNTENIILGDYTVNGTKVTTVKKGWYPTFNKCIWSSATAGTYSFRRTDSKLTIGNSTFFPEDFRGGAIPHEFIILVVGAGGGGGGYGYFSPGKDKSGFSKVPGGAGGGGGVIVGRLEPDDMRYHYITVGSGGSAGTNGSSNAKSTGAQGTNGGVSFFSHTDSTTSSNRILIANGGNGGKGGAPSGDDNCTPGKGGAGGAVDTTIASSLYVNYAGVSGGGGNSYKSHSNTERAAFTYTPTSGTGASPQNFANLSTNGDSYNSSSSASGSASYFSGGCSYGRGVHTGHTTDDAGYGGGGGGGSWKSAGKCGYVAIYY